MNKSLRMKQRYESMWRTYRISKNQGSLFMLTGITSKQWIAYLAARKSYQNRRIDSNWSYARYMMEVKSKAQQLKNQHR